jgi:hypothetical protein
MIETLLAEDGPDDVIPIKEAFVASVPARGERRIPA